MSFTDSTVCQTIYMCLQCDIPVMVTVVFTAFDVMIVDQLSVVVFHGGIGCCRSIERLSCVRECPCCVAKRGDHGHFRVCRGNGSSR